MIRAALSRLLNGKPEKYPKVPDWRPILEADRSRWDEARARADGPLVLIPTSSGGLPVAVMVESTLAVALTLRGARVHFLLCDEALPACLMTTINKYDRAESFVNGGPTAEMCASCWGQGRHVYEPLGLPIHRYGDLITQDEAAAVRRESVAVPYDEIESYEWDGLDIGEHVLAGSLRFVIRGDFEGEPHAEAIVRRYLHAGLRTAHATRRLLETHDFEHACFHHGIYVPQGIIGDVARASNVHVVNWMVGYRNQCFNFSHDLSYHLTLLDEPTEVWERLPWTPSMEGELMSYLDSRAHGSKDWVQFHDRPIEDVAAIEEALGVDFSKPAVVMLTNIVWDAQIHFDHNAFAGVLDWARETVEYFAGRPDLQLIIRVHPGEVKGTLKTRQSMADVIAEEFPELPPNIVVVPPDSRISTYAVAEQCDAAVIYGTKMGVELSAQGMPVIVAGEAWVRNKEITLDARSREEYFELLDRLPLGERMDPDRVERARRYAYHFFFRGMIPWDFMKPTDAPPGIRLAVDDLGPLMPGVDPGLDIVCAGILERAPFLYPAEKEHTRSTGTELAAS